MNKPVRSPLEQKRDLFAPITNVSRANRIAKVLFSPTARVFKLDDSVVIRDGSSPNFGEVFGAGATFMEAFMDGSKDVTAAEIVGLALPELKALHSATARNTKPR